MNEWTTCATWTALQAQHVPPPTEEIFTEISKDFNIRWNFPHCIERIDAYRVRIHCPPNCVSQYFKYRQCHSIVLQTVEDASLTLELWTQGSTVNKTMVEFSETRLCIRAWKSEICNSLKIQFCHLVTLHYLTFLLVLKHIP